MLESGKMAPKQLLLVRSSHMRSKCLAEWKLDKDDLWQRSPLAVTFTALFYTPLLPAKPSASPCTSPSAEQLGHPLLKKGYFGQRELVCQGIQYLELLFKPQQISARHFNALAWCRQQKARCLQTTRNNCLPFKPLYYTASIFALLLFRKH